jgi:hypothetical protein
MISHSYNRKQSREANRDAFFDACRRIFGGLPSLWDKPEGVAKFRKWSAGLIAETRGDVRDHLEAIFDKRRECKITNAVAWRILRDECKRQMAGGVVLEGGAVVMRMDRM